MDSSSSDARPSFWLLKDEVPSGPFDVAQIHAQLAAGEITWQTPACPIGGSDWKPLFQVPGVGLTPAAFLPAEPPRDGAIITAATLDVLPAGPVGSSGPRTEASPPVALVLPDGEKPKARPWNPVLIAWLGLPFTPMWAGVMAALNGRRLGSSVPWWLPLFIGFGYLALDLGQGYLFESYYVFSYLLSAVLYLGALGLLWAVVLKEQQRLFERWQSEAPAMGAGWAWPAITGVPLAVLAFDAFIIEPLRPLEPREVCERFVNAKSPKEAEKYVTLNLVPALRALAKLPDKNDPFDFELTDESVAPADVGGYLVGCRGSFIEGAKHTQIEGFFHLVNHSNEWKVEDIYFTAVDRQPLERWISVAQDYQAMLQASVPPPASSPPKLHMNPNVSKIPAKKGKSSDWMNSSLFGLGLIAVFAAIGWWWDQRSRGKATS